MPIYPITWSFRSFVASKMSFDASDVINKVAPVVTLEELYRSFNVSDEDRDLLLSADERMFGHYYRTYEVQLDGFDIDRPVPVDIKAPLPRNFERLTASSVFAPIFKLVQDWSMLDYTIENLMPLIPRSAVSALFPWIRDFIHDTDYDFSKDAKNKAFFRSYSIVSTQQRACHMCIRAAMDVPKHVPLVPFALRDAALLGNKLYTQWRLVKNRPIKATPEGFVKISPRVNYAFVPQYLKDAVDEMKELSEYLRTEGEEE